MALKDIKSKIRATQRTGKVTKAMEAVSAVKMRKGQERALAGRAYAEAALRILSRVSASQEREGHPLMRRSDNPRECVILITSDKGLAGSLNSAVLKSVHTILAGKSKEDVVLICLGKKGYEHFANREYDVVLHRTNVSDDVSLEEMSEITDKALGLFRGGEVGKVSIAYQNFVSTFYQNAVVRQILPLAPEFLEDIIRSIKPAEGKYSEESRASETPHIYTIEPDGESILDEIIPRLIEIMVYHAMLESKASEHSARMVAMKNASDKAKEVTKMLTLDFNKARQAVITREVSEITGGIEALRT